MRDTIEKGKVRVIKIGREALFEYIYENFVRDQGEYLDVKATEVSDYFEIDFENGSFIFCAVKSEDEEGNILSLPKEIDLKKVMKAIPDTADSMFLPNKKLYTEYTTDELTELSK